MKPQWMTGCRKCKQCETFPSIYSNMRSPLIWPYDVVANERSMFSHSYSNCRSLCEDRVNSFLQSNSCQFGLFMSATGRLESVIVQPPVVYHSTSTDSGGRCSCVRTCDVNGNKIYLDFNNSFVLKNAAWIIKLLEIYLRNLRNSNPRPALPMPESGDIEVLSASHIARSLGGVAARRRVGLSLDFSEFTSEELISKKCKLESMFCSHNSVASLNGSSGIFHRTILPRDLASRLNKSKPLLVLDCRPFFAYNANHIQGAVNINCTDRFNRRRLQQGKCSLVDLVSSKEGKDLYKKRCSKEIIVYDERTKDAKDLATDATLYLVLSVLKKEGKQASLLIGGLDGFQSDHEDLCKSLLKSQEHKPLYSPTTPIIEPAIETATASQILPFLYLGNERDAANLQRLNDLGITYVLNVTSHIPLHFENHGIKYKRIPASDSGQQNLRQYFEEASAFIDEAREAGAKLLVHCQAGVSRSATITIAFLLLHSRLSMSDAYRYVKSRRQIISPNFNFMGQLLDFEQTLNQGRLQRNVIPCLENVEEFL